MSRMKKKWRLNRSALRSDLIKIMSPTLAIAIIQTYAAFMHRRHIYKIWELLGSYPDAKKDYNKNLFGTTLTGSESFFKTMYFADRGFWERHSRKVPERLALGDANGIALSFMKSIAA